MCGVFREGRMPSRKIPPAPRTRCAAPGAKAGCVSLRQVSLHKQRKVARAVTARKLLILISAVAWREKSKSSSLRSPPHPALRATFSRKREKGCNRSVRLGHFSRRSFPSRQQAPREQRHQQQRQPTPERRIERQVRVERKHRHRKSVV